MADAATPPAQAAKVALTSELLRRWAQLEPFVYIGASKNPSPTVNLDASEIDTVKRWAAIFKEEIEAVRHARNFTAHLPAQFLPADELVEANEVASRLSVVLADSLPRFRSRLADATPSGSNSVAASASPEAREPTPPPRPQAAT